MSKRFTVFLCACCLLAIGLLPPETGRADGLGATPDLSRANWIWSSPKGLADGGPVNFFRKKFVLPSKPAEATIVLTADNGYELYVNNRRIAVELGYSGTFWGSVERFRIEGDLTAGANVIAIRGESLGGSSGVVAAVHIRTADGQEMNFVTDPSWLATVKLEEKWPEPNHDDSHWKPAAVVAPMGGRPWGMLTAPDRLTDPTKLVVERSRPGQTTPLREEKFARPGKGFQWPEGAVFLCGNVPKPHHFAFSRRGPGNKRVSWRSHAYPENDVPAPAVLGQQMYCLVPASPDGQPTLLLDAGKGTIGSPRVSFDGKTIYFSMAPEGEGFYRIYRMPAVGGAPEALTEGPFHDYDPEPLPDGRIVFSSTRIGGREEYHSNLASSLFVMNADGSGIRPLTYHIVADREPRVTAFGSLVMVRSDNFLERAKVETQIHQIRMDGTGGLVLMGNDRGPIQYLRPLGDEAGPNPGWLRANGFGSPAPLPDGRVAALSREGLVIAGIGTKGRQPVQTGVELFDISPMPDGRLLCTTWDRRSLGIVDPDTGDVWRLYRSDKPEVHSVVYLGPRQIPPAMASVIAEEDCSLTQTGYLYCQSVFNTKQTEADLSRIKAIRVYEGRPLASRPDHFPYMHIGVEAVELGAVPLGADGSFYARVPADRPLALQAVDGEGRAVINELSWIYVRPGEQRSCVGCHAPRYDAPPAAASSPASRTKPADLLGQGQPYRFRGNNAEVGGVLNLQLDRMREAAAIDLYPPPQLDESRAGIPLPPGRSAQVQRLCKQLAGEDAAMKISSAQRLAVFRDRAATPALAQALKDRDREVRMDAAMALAACGDRDAVPALLLALRDAEPVVAQAANVALENLTGHSVGFDLFFEAGRENGAAAWELWLKQNDWDAMEADLVKRLANDDPQAVIKAIQALGHIGGDAARAALRDFAVRNADEDASDLRALMAAMRALGYLRDAEAVSPLADILNRHIEAKPPQRNVYLAAAAAEALGWIGTPEAEKALVDACPRLQDFWLYSGICGDHRVLVACHASILHYRFLEAFDAMGTRSVEIVSAMIRSVPCDLDRGLLLESDSYENLAACVVQRSGLYPALIETCLHALGDPSARPHPAFTAVLQDAYRLRSQAPGFIEQPVEQLMKKPRGGLNFLPYVPEMRAAQLISILALDARWAPRVADAFERYLSKDVTATGSDSIGGEFANARTRAWVCFYLAKALGRMRCQGSAECLLAALEKDSPEGSVGCVTPPAAMIYRPVTPFYRAAAAYALGEVGDRRAVPFLLKAVSNFENALDVRHAAAQALGLLCNRSDLPALSKLAEDYPEVVTRRVLLEACQKARSRAEMKSGTEKE